MKIGLLVIATNKYIDFVQQLSDTARLYFLQGHEVNIFVFTDRPIVPSGCIRVEQEHYAWPGPTLMRYHMFDKHKEVLSKMDYLFYSDADMKFVDVVGDEVLGKLVGTIHPGYFNKSRLQFSYDNNPNSEAYMGPHQGNFYFAGGFNGGTSENFLRMSKTINERVDIDKSKGIVALWHDESHMNKYFHQNPPTVILSPSYCYPESMSIPFKKRLLALDKNHHDMRFGK